MRRVVRGGSWINTRHAAVCADRGDYHPDYQNHNVGLRLVVELDAG